jgi:hypothetical protein
LGRGMGGDGKRGRGSTFAAVGCIYSSLTLFAVFPTVVVNQPNPFVNAATGSFCRSSKPGNFASAGLSIGALPKPAYFPPWLGGRSAGLLALAAPSPAKYLSSTLAFPVVVEAGGRREGEEVRPSGVWERLFVEEVGKDIEVEGGFEPGTYSFPSTLADRRSLYSSPTSPE